MAVHILAKIDEAVLTIYMIKNFNKYISNANGSRDAA